MPEMNLIRTYGRVKVVIGNLLLGDGLKAKAMRAEPPGAGSVTEQVARFARNMILTRSLAPGAFGAMAIVLSCSAIIATLTDVGQRASVIQNPRGGRERLP